MAEVEEALETIGAKQRRMIIEEQELSELKTEMQDYEEDIEDFKRVSCSSILFCYQLAIVFIIRIIRY